METIIKEDKEYFGQLINHWDDSDMGCYVITGMISNKENTTDRRIGRVVQVRLEAGDFGSHCVLLRHCDNILSPHENQCFYRIPEKFKVYLDDVFKDVYLDDATKIEYTLGGEFPETGFIIASKIPECESTPLRDIKNRIMEKIEQIADISDVKKEEK